MKADESHLLQSLCAIDDPAEMRRVLSDLLTRSELAALRKRWAILCLLRDKACASATLMDRLDKAAPK